MTDPSTEQIQQVVDVVKAVVPNLFITIDVDTPLLSTGIVDSLSLSELSDELSRRFDVDLDARELVVDKANTPRDMANLIAVHKGR